MPLRISDAAAVAGGTLLVHYGAELQLGEVAATTFISDFAVFTTTETVGEVTIGFAGTRELAAGAAEVFTLRFAVAETAAPGSDTAVEVLGARLNDLAGRDFATVLERPVRGGASAVQVDLGEVGDPPVDVPALSGVMVLILVGLLGGLLRKS